MIHFYYNWKKNILNLLEFKRGSENWTDSVLCNPLSKAKRIVSKQLYGNREPTIMKILVDRN